MAEALESGELQRHVYDRLQPALGNRYRRLVKAVHEYLIPLGVRIPQTDREIVGGYFIWMTLPSPLKSATLAKRAKEEENVVVAQVSTEWKDMPDSYYKTANDVLIQGEIFEVSSLHYRSVESSQI